MKPFIRSRMSLFVACAAAFVGGLALLIANGERILEGARFASANAATRSTVPASEWNDLDFLLCHTPTQAAGAVTRSMIRLAAAQTEAPQAKTNAASPALAFADSDPPVWNGLGSLSYKVTTSSAAAQVYFDQGLRLTYAFNHEEAQRAFRKAQKLDPDCAMCFWGEALVLGPNINLPMPEEAVAPAFAAMQKARTLAAKASPREQALITALSARYVEDAKADRTQLDAAYATAMANVTAQFPADNEIAVLYAESVMDISPWNYWQPGGREPNPQSAPIVPALERVLARDPDHPGAIHGAGHLVHMPSHIYYRVGRYLDALGDNKTAMAVDEKYLAASEAPMGVYRLGYYPHNVHFVLASALMSGDGTSGITAAEKLRGLVPDQAALGIPNVTRRDLSSATAEASAIEALARTADFSLLKTAGSPASDVLELARSVIEGRVALAQGDANKAIERFEQAAGLQETLPYMEPPYWYYPVRQSLAVALMQAGRLDDAEGQFRRALARAPNNGWSYYGLAELYRTRGDTEAARKAEAELAKTWVGDRQLLQLSKL